MADNGNGVYGKPKQIPQSTGDAFKTFIWNSSTGEFCGRTGGSWFKITAFYIVFFCCLSLFFLAMFWLFWQTMSEDKPKWIGAESLIGTNPGVGFRPMPDQDKNAESTLIWINRRVDKDGSYWADQLDEFFEKNYKDNPTGLTCTFENGITANATNPCKVNVGTTGSCSKENRYGYVYTDPAAQAQPCVLVKLNKIFDWVPDPYNSEEDMKTAEEREMPEDLQELIKGYIKTSDNRLNTTWISCAGENAGDRENLGDIEYSVPGIPGQFQGIPNFYFPYSMQKGYQSPFIFIKFLSPKTNVLLQVECKAWALNIKADRFSRLGSVHFELMID